MQDAGTGGHPLRVAFADDAAATVRVVVRDHAVDDVGDRLEAAVRVPRRADRLVRCVLDRAELVEQEERVGDVGVDAAGERAPHLEPGALDGMVGGHDDLRRVGHAPVGAGTLDAGQDERVLDGDRGHASRNGTGPAWYSSRMADRTLVASYRLEDPRHLFKAPDDPFSPDYGIGPVLDEVVNDLYTTTSYRHVHLTLELPPEETTPGSVERIRTAIGRYCDQSGRELDRTRRGSGSGPRSRSSSRSRRSSAS